METNTDIKRLDDFFSFIERKSSGHKVPKKFLEIKGHMEKMKEEKSKLPNLMWMIRVVRLSNDVASAIKKNRGMKHADFKEILQKAVSELDMEFGNNLYVRNEFIDKLAMKIMAIGGRTFANYWNALNSMSTDDRVLMRIMRHDMQQHILPDYFLGDIIKKARFKAKFIDYLITQGFDRENLNDIV